VFGKARILFPPLAHPHRWRASSFKSPRASSRPQSPRRGHRAPNCKPHDLRIKYRNLYARYFPGKTIKTTLDLNDTLLIEAKALAARQRTSLTRLIEEGLQLRLRAQRAPTTKPVRLPVYRGKGGLAPGLDGLSNKALLDAADRDA